MLISSENSPSHFLVLRGSFSGIIFPGAPHHKLFLGHIGLLLYGAPPPHPTLQIQGWTLLYTWLGTGTPGVSDNCEVMTSHKKQNSVINQKAVTSVSLRPLEPNGPKMANDTEATSTHPSGHILKYVQGRVLVII